MLGPNNLANQTLELTEAVLRREQLPEPWEPSSSMYDTF
jgi:hypothetical protein